MIGRPGTTTSRPASPPGLAAALPGLAATAADEVPAESSASTAGTALAGLPPRTIEDLPTELWWKFADYLDLEDRAMLFDFHPALANRAGAARALADARGPTDIARLAATIDAALGGTTPAGHTLTGHERQDIVRAGVRQAGERLKLVTQPADHAPINAMLVACLARLDELEPDEGRRLLTVLLKELGAPLKDVGESIAAGQDRLAARLLDRLLSAVAQGSPAVLSAIAGDAYRVSELIRVAARGREDWPRSDRLLGGQTRLLRALAGGDGPLPPAEACARLAALLQVGYHHTGAAADVVVPMLVRLLDAAHCDGAHQPNLVCIAMMLPHLPSADARLVLEATIRYAGRHPVDGTHDDNAQEIRSIRSWLSSGILVLNATDARAVETALRQAEAQVLQTAQDRG
ncbi:hypothetical protein [Xylophilus sp. GOD-11R]|uniref:hypothetical protein n=1 Tax=Xylophilus sp. GOD-11R TaxID=3089814 RepID=UPI00298C74EF|nr:hypothetical protein [Xylophilus sp. GOD-11R]WPB56193.1 hypothetical protein R9X41_18905 [Xylophilus sp. GOD-11R]